MLENPTKAKSRKDRSLIDLGSQAISLDQYVAAGPTEHYLVIRACTENQRRNWGPGDGKSTKQGEDAGEWI